MAEKKDVMEQQGTLDMDRPGDKLRRGREALGLTLQEVATRTRVPIRQLEVLERNEFSALPGIPYAVGFARAYARAIDMDETVIAQDVRRELGSDSHSARYETFEPADPARVPPRALAWTAAVIALVLAAAYGIWRTQMFTPPVEEPAAEVAANAPAGQPARASAAPQRPAPAEGPVVLTATDAVWLRIYDQAGERLYEKQMAKGESFTVPANANNPMILTGRPDALAVTVGGRPVPALGTAERTIADFPISAAALLARPPAPAPVPATPASSPQPGSPPAAR
ncbi:MAG: DUF4115 domain-containing protein [Sphingobium sp.]|nr:MAG: DUF4115 domain-containing protein [Sphingobium sp.]